MCMHDERGSCTWGHEPSSCAWAERARVRVPPRCACRATGSSTTAAARPPTMHPSIHCTRPAHQRSPHPPPNQQIAMVGSALSCLPHHTTANKPTAQAGPTTHLDGGQRHRRALLRDCLADADVGHAADGANVAGLDLGSWDGSWDGCCWSGALGWSGLSEQLQGGAGGWRVPQYPCLHTVSTRPPPPHRARPQQVPTPTHHPNPWAWAHEAGRRAGRRAAPPGLKRRLGRLCPAAHLLDGHAREVVVHVQLGDLGGAHLAGLQGAAGGGGGGARGLGGLGFWGFRACSAAEGGRRGLRLAHRLEGAACASGSGEARQAQAS